MKNDITGEKINELREIYEKSDEEGKEKIFSVVKEYFYNQKKESGVYTLHRFTKNLNRFPVSEF
jgi:hypothetical protein